MVDEMEELRGARRGRVGWGVALVGVVVLGLLGVRAGWGWVAGRLLAEEVRGIEGRGEPIWPGDFEGRGAEGGREVVGMIMRAGAGIVYTAAENRWAAGFTGRGTLSAYDVRVLGGIVEENRESLELVRRAREVYGEVDGGGHEETVRALGRDEQAGGAGALAGVEGAVRNPHPGVLPAYREREKEGKIRNPKHEIRNKSEGPNSETGEEGGESAAQRAAAKRGRDAVGGAHPTGGAGGGVDWGVRGRRPTFNEERKLALLVCNVALYEHARGRDAEAVRRVRDALFLARVLEWKGAMPVTHQSAVGVGTMACQTIGEMAPTLGEAARGEMRAAIAELLDERGVEEGMVRSLQGRRMADLDGAEAFGREVFRGAGYWALRPMVVMDTRRLLREDGEMIRAVGAGSYPAAVRGLPPTATDAKVRGMVPHLEEVARVYSEVGGMPGELYVRMQYLHLLDRRLAAVALAVRLWRLDHGGEWPGELGELVPGYLAGVPGDPMGREGERLGYARRGRGAILYSVGMNGSDEGGDGRPYDPKNVSAVRTLRYDMVYWLGEESGS